VKYEDFDTFKIIIEKILTPFLKHYNPNIKRLGLRYVNEIKIKKGHPFEWKDLINPSLTANIDKFLDNKSELSRAMSQLIINKGYYNITFSYGMFNSEYPSKISRKEFILDYDCYTFEIENNNEINKELDIFNNEINKLFEKSINDGLRKILELSNE